MKYASTRNKIYLKITFVQSTESMMSERINQLYIKKTRFLYENIIQEIKTFKSTDTRFTMSTYLKLERKKKYIYIHKVSEKKYMYNVQKNLPTVVLAMILKL